MFQISTRDINQAAIALASGLKVETLRQAATRRAVFYFDGTQQIRALIDQYERGECLHLPAKAILQARTQLYHEAKRVSLEGV